MRITPGKYYRLLLLISLFCTQCESIDYVEIPFETDKVGHIIVPLRINGVEINGIFDTGGQGSSILYSDFTAMKLKRSSVIVSKQYPYIYGEKSLKLAQTRPIKFNIGKLVSKDKVAFTVHPDSIGFSHLGNDIINQYCWYFNFKTMKVTISEVSINIDTTSCIAIPYKDTNSMMCCSVHMNKSITINNIFIDTGGTGLYNNDTHYPITLFLTKTSLTDNNMIIGGKKAKIDIKKSVFPASKNVKEKLLFPFHKDEYGTPIYEGIIFLFGGGIKKIFDNEEVNGSINIGYSRGIYSGLYLDTHKKTLYLKP